MICHMSLGVADLARAIALYDALIATLGCVRCFTGPVSVGYGPPGGPERLALKQRPAEAIGVDDGFHLAFEAADRSVVDRFYEAALAHGARDDGAPGPRPGYGATYYAAFVIDHDGHRLEVVHQ